MKNSPHIAFFGTSDFSVVILEHLKKEGLLPALIVTAPDKPQGRKLVVTPPPVKVWAEQEQMKIIQPESLREIPKEIRAKEWDLFIVVSYGKILPKELLEIPLRGTLNVHPSLLPKFRGASPIQSAILEDEQDTGVTIMLLDDKMDHGPIVAQASVTTLDWPPPFRVLEALLADVGGSLLAETILPWLNGEIKEEKQDHDLATYTKKITKEDGLLDLEANPYENFLKIRALEKWPGTYYFEKYNDKEVRVKITEAVLEDNKLVLKKVIPEGKKEMSYEDFKHGLRN